jgi:glycosyltransferase involved in cell wall biosynthesis
MRILHIHDIAHVGETLVEGLRQLGHDAQLRQLNLAARHSSTLIKLLVSPLRLREMLRVNQEVRRDRYDIVHIHFAYLGWLGILGRYPYFLHCHGSDVRRDLKDWRRRWFIQKSIQQAKKVFFVTPDLAEIVQSIRPDAIYLPNPVRTDLFRPHPRPTDNKIKILFISAFDPIKRPDIAITGVQPILEQYPEVELTVINIGSLRQQYYGLKNTQFISPVSHDGMADLINACDIVVGQLGIGSLGMSELESLSCGKPIICHFTHDSWYSYSPAILSANTAQEVNHHLQALIKQPQVWQSMGEINRNWVEKFHGYLVITSRLIDIYNRTT